MIIIASSPGAGAPKDSTWCCPYLAPRLTEAGQPYQGAGQGTNPNPNPNPNPMLTFLLSFGLID